MSLRVPTSVLMLVLAAQLGACKQPKDTAPPPVTASGLPRDRPVAPGAPAELSKPDEARVKMDLLAARSAIRMFQQTNSGANPPDITSFGVNYAYPADLSYDPATGTVKNKTYPQF